MKKLIIFLGVAALAITASAQNQAGRQNAGDRFFPGVTRVLTDAQRKSLQAALASQYGQIQPLEKTMRTSRQALLNQITGGNFNEDAARQAAQASASAEAELTVIYAKALSQMSPPLSADQLQQVKNFQPGQFQRGAEGGNAAQEGSPTPPPSHLPLPPELPHDANGLPVVN